MLRSAKDRLDLQALGVYWSLCECGQVYVGQSRRTFEARCKEHMKHVWINLNRRQWQNIASVSVVPQYETEHQDTWTAL
jgi:hypothetical protein